MGLTKVTLAMTEGIEAEGTAAAAIEAHKLEDDAHTIDQITGLQEELDNIPNTADFAQKNGDVNEVFNVKAGTSINSAVPRGELDGYKKTTDATKTFKAAAGVAADDVAVVSQLPAAGGGVLSTVEIEEAGVAVLTVPAGATMMNILAYAAGGGGAGGIQFTGGTGTFYMLGGGGGGAGEIISVAGVPVKGGQEIRIILGAGGAGGGPYGGGNSGGDLIIELPVPYAARGGHGAPPAIGAGLANFGAAPQAGGNGFGYAGEAGNSINCYGGSGGAMNSPFSNNGGTRDQGPPDYLITPSILPDLEYGKGGNGNLVGQPDGYDGIRGTGGGGGGATYNGGSPLLHNGGDGGTPYVALTFLK